MIHDAGNVMKLRLRQDLRAAMKEGRADEARLIRALLAALDNAEAPPPQNAPMTEQQHRFHEGSAEVQRLVLQPESVRAVLLAEIGERERAAAEMARHGVTDRAEALRKEIELVRVYLSD